MTHQSAFGVLFIDELVLQNTHVPTFFFFVVVSYLVLILYYYSLPF